MSSAESTNPSGNYRSDEIDVIGVLRALWDGKWIIALIATLGVGLSVYLALTARPIFEAEALVSPVVESGASGGSGLLSQLGGLGNFAGLGIGKDQDAKTTEAILRSRQLAETFILNNDIVAELSPAEGEQLTLWQAVRQFRDLHLTFKNYETSGLIGVAIRWPDPDVAAGWANDFVLLANETLRQRDIKESEQNIQYLNSQIEKTTVAELQRVMYNLIENETQTLMLANARQDYAFALVDAAVAPEIRVSPKRKLMVMSGGALGLLGGVLLVLFLRLAREVRSRPATSG